LSSKFVTKLFLSLLDLSRREKKEKKTGNDTGDWDIDTAPFNFK
jgi:hypothetical protein